jgi:hypothetical protein
MSIIEILGQATGVIGHEVTVTGNNGAGATTVASSAMTTNGPNRLLIAVVSTDGTGAAAITVSSIAGASLTWVNITGVTKATTFERVEVWRAFATSSFSSQTITATLSASDQATIVVSAYTGTNKLGGTNGSAAIGATGTGTGSDTIPSASLTTKGRQSLVIGGVAANSNPSVSINSAASQTLNGSDAAQTAISGGQGRNKLPTIASGQAVSFGFVLGSSQPWAAVAVELLEPSPGPIFDVSSNALYTTGANLTFSHTVGTTYPNRLLVVTVNRRSGDATSTVTYAGTSMTLAKRSTNGTAETSEIYHLANPATSANNVVITPSPTGPDFRASASSYYFMDQNTTNVLDTTGGGAATAGNVSHSVTTAVADELLVNGIAHESTAAPTLPAGQTSIHLTDEGTWDTGASYKILAGAAGAYSMGFNNANSDTYAHAIAAFRPNMTVFLSAYRFYANNNSTDVGAALASNDTNADTPAPGTVFRLRLLIHVRDAQLDSSGKNFKLQFAARGTDNSCDETFYGETYSDVATSGDIQYDTTNSPADGAALTGNSADPTHDGDTRVNQTYEEANNFTNSQAAIPAGQDGKWDFAIKVNSGVANGNVYCFRVFDVDTSDTLDYYSVIPEVTVLPENGWILFGGLPFFYLILKRIKKKKFALAKTP